MTTLAAPSAVGVSFDIREIPFSRRGSWLNLSPITGIHQVSDDVHLVDHVSGIQPILALTPTVRAERVESSVEGDESTLIWSGGDDEQIEATFETLDTIRVRGTGLGMHFTDAAGALTPFTGNYMFQQPDDGALVFTSYETGRRYRITVIEGHFDVTGTEALGAAKRALKMRDGQTWEVAIESFQTARPRYRKALNFDEIATNVRGAFSEYLDAIAPWRSAAVPAAQLAVYVLWSATVSPQGELTRESILMSKHWMDRVWSWDHCFNSMAILPAGIDKAIEQFRVPFDKQDPYGALPDSVSRHESLYNFVKPPIHGWALRKIRQESDQTIDAETLHELYDALARWTRFWLDHRRAPGQALPYYEHGNDSGWDNSTMFDTDKVIEAPDLAAFLIVQLEVLADLAVELGKPDDWHAEKERILTTLIEEFWDGTAFVAKSAITKRPSSSTSLLNVMPVIAADHFPPAIADTLAESVSQFLTEWGLATELVNSDHYESDGYWRGPIWAPSTALIEDGLRRAGYTDIADTINARFCRLCEVNGFAENFDALTGQGLRDHAYTWTASVYLTFAADAVRRGTTGGPPAP